MSTKQVHVRFTSPGSFRGAVSGRMIRYEPGDEMTLPKGELDHVRNPGGNWYQTRPIEGATDTGDTREDIERSYESNGAWKTLFVSGDQVAKVMCSKDEADAWAAGTLSLDDLQS